MKATPDYFPRAGIYAAGGGGEIHSEVLRQHREYYQANEAYNGAQIRVHVDFEGGIGQLNRIGD